MPTRARLVVPLAAALLLFGAPLFVGLGNWDLENDEAIYSYSVDRILETGEWLTPRSVIVDGPFLEKPPLKMWMVAGGILLGLPHDEAGLRALDVVFAVAAFAYVFLLGYRLAGPVCGFVALLVLHTCWPLVFEHGLRTNNMEAALLLANSGGVYHFGRWAEATRPRERRGHAWMVCAFFAFAFLMKFVAALLLPAILGAALVWRPDLRGEARAAWRDFRWPAVAAVAVIAPWFAYAWMAHGRVFWDTILGQHVVERFTAYLDPAHVKPWYFYFARTYEAFSRPAVLPGVIACGLALIAARAWRGQPWLTRLVLAWGVVPYVLLSLGTSKLFHYAYPFLPPLALAAGVAAARGVELATLWIGRLPAAQTGATEAGRAWRRRALQGLACVALALGLWAVVVGPVTFTTFGVRWFRNASLLRPAAAGVLLIWLAGERRAALRVAAAVAILYALPIWEYAPVRAHMASVRHPLHTIRECGLNASAARNGAYVADPMAVTNPHFYYLRAFGPWTEGPASLAGELPARLFTAGRQAPVLVPARSLAATLRDMEVALERGGRAGVYPNRGLGVRGVEVEPSMVVLLPGPYGVCTAAATSAGGVPVSVLWGTERPSR